MPLLRPTPRLRAGLALAAALTAGQPVAPRASGFALPEVSVAGLGLANALVANPEATGAFPYNPAAMAFHDRSSIALGTLLILPDVEARTAGGRHRSQGADLIASPVFQAALRLDDRWRLGVSLNAPFGMETRWRDGTFPAVSGQRPIQAPPPLAPEIPRGPHPLASKLEILDLTPSLAWRAGERLSLAAGLDLYWAKTAELDSSLTRLQGDGGGLGYRLGALYRAGDWSLGAAFRSSSDLELTGRYAPGSETLAALKMLPPGQRAKVELALPWQLQIGARYRFAPNLAAELDWALTGWSRFDRLQVRSRTTGDLLFADTNGWRNADAWRLGIAWTPRPELELRCGYSLDRTGQGDAHFSARVPDNDRHLFGLGLAWTLGGGYRLEAGYLYVQAERRRHRGDRPPAGGDLNGTTALDGEYRLDAHLVGLELVRQW